MAKFKSAQGGHLALWLGDHPKIDIQADEPYETDDKDLINLLREQDSVEEVKSTESNKRAESDEKSKK